MRGYGAGTARNNLLCKELRHLRIIFVTFNTFAFHPQINEGISSAGYTSPTPIQKQTIPAIRDGKDVLGLAQTGTGKTAAFVLPILQHLMKGPRGKVRALILAPTRELAEQTHVFIKQLGRKTGLRSVTVYGGVSSRPQIDALHRGVEIVVACPGRLLDLHGQRLIDLSHVEILVLDEGDHMFDMGFLPSIRRIIDALPTKRQTLLFSATMPDEVRSLATNILSNPVTVEIKIDEPIDTISHAFYLVDAMQKLDLLQQLLNDSHDGQVLVFCRTKHRTKKLTIQLQKAGFSATSLQGNLSQPQRQTAMNAFRNGKVQTMVATDIAARGIDVSNVSQVINFDLPVTPDIYTHRTGRTGRMERLGTAVSLATHEDLEMVRKIERLMGQNMELRRMNGFEVSTLKSHTSMPPVQTQTRTKAQSQNHNQAQTQKKVYNKNRFHAYSKNR